jgi:endothelin-converting enzyme/putative endopeptidase
MNLRSLLLVAMVAGCGSHPGQPQGGPATGQHGVYVSDLDRAADPCTDFFAFSNGAWRKENPIPASMTRWSRRWQAGETAKDRLKDILDEVSAKRDWRVASVEQLIGDFYGGCMDQARIDARGLEPIKPLLADIDKLREPGDVGKMIARLHAIAVFAPFGVFGNSDLHTPTNVVAWATAGGLGLPDRDYYVKTEPRFVEARDKYLAHVAAMFKLAGRDDAAAKRAADTVMAFELGLAKASLDNVALRDPRASDHTMTVAQLQALTPSFD